MLLYVCKQCGSWQDVSIGNFLTKTWNDAFKETPSAQIKQSGYPCPEGHGFMVQVQPTDKLYIHPSVVDTVVVEPLMIEGE